MRISDWSSDVCSSDLPWSIDRPLAPFFGKLFGDQPLPPLCQRRANLAPEAGITHRHRRIGNQLAVEPCRGLDGRHFVDRHRRQDFDRYGPIAELLYLKPLNLVEMEIGRASCRERVCQYV